MYFRNSRLFLTGFGCVLAARPFSVTMSTGMKTGEHFSVGEADFPQGRQPLLLFIDVLEKQMGTKMIRPCSHRVCM